MGLFMMMVAKVHHHTDIDRKGMNDDIDDKNEVPFIREFEDNENLSKLAPSFQKLEELNKTVKTLQKENKDLEKEKNT